MTHAERPSTDLGRRRWWPTASEIADDVRANLAAGDEDHALRMLIDGVNYLPDAHAAGQLDEALVEPESTGDPRWDALLAGAIRYRLHQSGLAAPLWTRKEPLNRFWWPYGPGPARAAYDMANAPAELKRLGIFLARKDFAAA